MLDFINDLELRIHVTMMLVASGYTAWLLTSEDEKMNEIVWAKSEVDVARYRGGSIHKLRLPKQFTAERRHTFVLDELDGGTITTPPLVREG